MTIFEEYGDPSDISTMASPFPVQYKSRIMPQRWGPGRTPSTFRGRHWTQLRESDLLLLLEYFRVPTGFSKSDWIWNLLPPIQGLHSEPAENEPAGGIRGLGEISSQNRYRSFLRDTFTSSSVGLYSGGKNSRQKLQIQTSGLAQVFCVNCPTVQTQSTWYVWMFHFVFFKNVLIKTK